MKFSNNFEDVEKVVMELSKKDLLHIWNGIFKKSPYTKYRLCLLVENNSVGFVEVYNLPEEKYEFIVIAVAPKYRNKGYSKILLDKLFKDYNNKYPYMWRCDKNNKESIYLANKYNFKKINETETKYEFEKND